MFCVGVIFKGTLNSRLRIIRRAKTMKDKSQEKLLNFFKKNIDFIIAFFGVFAFFVIFSFFKPGKNIESSIYDLLLKIKPTH